MLYFGGGGRQGDPKQVLIWQLRLLHTWCYRIEKWTRMFFSSVEFKIAKWFELAIYLLNLWKEVANHLRFQLLEFFFAFLPTIKRVARCKYQFNFEYLIFWNLGNISNIYQPSISHSGILWCWWPMFVPQASIKDSKQYFLNLALGWLPFLLHNISFIDITFWHSMMLMTDLNVMVTIRHQHAVQFTNILLMIFQKIKEILNVRYTLTIFTCDLDYNLL